MRDCLGSVLGEEAMAHCIAQARTFSALDAAGVSAFVALLA